MDLCRALDERTDSVRLDELGRTTEGRPIPLMIVADPMVASPEEARASGKLVALLVGNIHAGEVCGKEALPRLVRELTDDPDHPLLKDLVLLVVPNFNADGNEQISKDNRPGQVGPEMGMGRRANGQGLDLNRDFVKLESPEARALVALMNEWDPAVVVDTHTTNGSLHRYVLTYQGPQNPAGSPVVLRYVRDRMFPEVVSKFERATDQRAFYYGNFEEGHTLWSGFPDSPRYFTNYVGLRNRIGILTEAYAYATYEERVLATLAFVRATLEFASEHAGEVRDLLARADGDAATSEVSVIASALVPFPEPATVLGFEESREGGRTVAGAPKDYEEVRVVQDYEAWTVVSRPYAYAIPSEYSGAIEAVKRHGLATSVLSAPATVEATSAEVEAIGRADRPFEGASIGLGRSRRCGGRRRPPQGVAGRHGDRPDRRAARRPRLVPPGARVGRRPRHLGPFRRRPRTRPRVPGPSDRVRARRPAPGRRCRRSVRPALSGTEARRRVGAGGDRERHQIGT